MLESLRHVTLRNEPAADHPPVGAIPACVCGAPSTRACWWENGSGEMSSIIVYTCDEHPVLSPRDLVKQAIGSPLVVEGQALPWTLTGLIHQAELEELTAEQVRESLDMLKKTGEVIELPTGGLILTGV
jgi:hypothetical protein